MIAISCNLSDLNSLLPKCQVDRLRLSGSGLAKQVCPLLVGLGFMVLLASGDQKFWSKQDVSKWTRDQVAQFMTASPWVKQVTALLVSNNSNMAGSMPRGQGGRSPSSRVNSSNPASVTMPRWQATVRWASAKPIQFLLKAHLPDAFQGRYVISVSGLPVGGDADELLQQTTLQTKRGGTVHPEDAYQDPGDTSTIYFAFLPSMVDAANGKTALFRMLAPPYEVDAKFTFSEMKLMGEPSL